MTVHLRPVPCSPPPRLDVRISVFDRRYPIGRAGPFRLTERDFAKLIETAERLEARQ